MANAEAEYSLSLINVKDFKKVQSFLYEASGIYLSDVKQALVSSRLSGRMRLLGMTDFGDYFCYATAAQNLDERVNMIDVLTTNETYFFREPEHFVFLRKLLVEHRDKSSWRLWSGASSSGEEIYTIAMVMADELELRRDWQILGTDLSTKVLKQAAVGHYPLERNGGISKEHLKKYCLKGVSQQSGSFLIDDSLRSHCEFTQQNLVEPCVHLGKFDIIFLRNVMIYFDSQSKQRVLNNVLAQLKPGGYFIISHTESLINMSHDLIQLRPSIFKKP